MTLLPKEPDRRRPSNAIMLAIAAALVLIAVLVSLSGLVHGGGEAVGLKGAAPGDNNASSAATGRGN